MAIALDEKIMAVTGANGGIGYETALAFARYGATVVMICRDAARGAAARAAIQQATGNERVDLLLADLASLDQVRRVAEQLKARYQRLDVLVNNAGLYMAQRQLTPDGYESTFAINHLAHFLLTNLLCDMLVASAPARVVVVSSEAHYMGQIRMDDLQTSRRRYIGLRAYCDSKLANVVFTLALARRLAGSGVSANALHPGIVNSNFAKSAKSPLGMSARAFARWNITSAEGAQPSIYLATAAELEGTTGLYFNKLRVAPPKKVARDHRLQERFWQRSAELTGLSV